MKDINQLIKSLLAAKCNILDEYQSKQVLASYGIPVVNEILADNERDVLAAAEKIGYPVVLKGCGANIAHKTEMGMVEVGITGPAELEQVLQRLLPRVQQEQASILVQRMIKGDRELVLGMSRDPGFGPCVMVGFGGIFAEAIADVSFRVAPLSYDDAKEMINDLTTAKIFQEFRGMPSVDVDELAKTLVALGDIAINHPEIKEIDINPLIIEGSSSVAADALIVLGDPQSIPEPVKPTQDLSKFFSPGSVAVIGASATPGKSGHDVVKNILANGFDNDLYLVNPKGGMILGRQVYKTIEDLPEGIDLAIITLPAALTYGAVSKCRDKKVASIVMAAGGFAEVDEDGVALQEQIMDLLKQSDMRALGPNTAGHISTPAHFTSSFFPLGKIPSGTISYITQTGNFATHTMRYIMSNEHYGIARVVGMGNKLDIEESELLEYLADDPCTTAIFMYLESIKYPRRFLEIAKRTTSKKPIVLLKGGASPEGAGAAVAHTAALASDDRIIEGALNQAGVVRVYKYSHLFQVAKAAAMMPLPKGNRVSFSAPSGAMLVCMTDYCRRVLDLETPQFTEENRQRLQDISPPYIRMRNPVDIWPAATFKSVEIAYGEAIEVGLVDPNIDAVISVLMLTDETGIPDYDFIVKLAEKYPEKPLYITFTGDKEHMESAKKYLEPRGIPTFELIEEAFEVLDVLCRCGASLQKKPD